MNRQLAICAALMLTLPALASANSAAFESGVAAYEAGRYATAAAAFKKSLLERPAAGTLVNLGLAEWQCGRSGGAVLAWQRAEWLDPFRSDARDNLAFARESTGINAPDLKWFELVSAWLPANCWTAIAGISLWLAVAMMTVPAFLRMRRAGWHQTTAALALGVFLVSVPPSVGVVTRCKISIVMSKDTALRLTPTRTAETILLLREGEPVRRRGTHGNFVFVQTQNGNGWLEKSQIQNVCPSQRLSTPQAGVPAKK